MIRIALVLNGSCLNFAESILLEALRQLYGKTNVLVFSDYRDAKRRLPANVSHLVCMYCPKAKEKIEEIFMYASGIADDVSTVLAVSDLQDHSELEKSNIDYDDLLVCPEKFQGPKYATAMSRIFGPYIGKVEDLEYAVNHFDDVPHMVIKISHASRIDIGQNGR